MSDRYFMVGIVLFIFVIGMIAVVAAAKKKDGTVSTIDDTQNDLSALSDFIGRLPQAWQDAIADGTLTLSLDWMEVTRDEDDYPTIKPRVVFTSTKTGAKYGPTTA